MIFIHSASFILRFIPNKSAEGFLVAPYIFTNADYLAAMSGKYWGNYVSNKSKKNSESILRRIKNLGQEAGGLTVKRLAGPAAKTFTR